MAGLCWERMDFQEPAYKQNSQKVIFDGSIFYRTALSCMFVVDGCSNNLCVDIIIIDKTTKRARTP